MRVGVLTGGGDCPGLNAVIRAVVRRGEVGFDDEFVGFLDGWRGVIEDRTMVARRRALPRHPAARRHHPRHVADQSLQGRRRRGEGAPYAANRAHRRPGGHRGRGHPRRRQQAGGRGRLRRGGAEDNRQRPLRPPRSRSAFTPPCRSPRRPSTGCTPRPSLTIG